MNRLLKLVRTATPGTRVKFRPETYGSEGIGRFLRDVLAMANSGLEGPRYIITGVGLDENGQRHYRPVGQDDFSGEPPYQALVVEYIEPPVRITYQPVTIDSQSVGVFEIGNCQDTPYMMRIDYSERLRRGDAYSRVENVVTKIGRNTLLRLFELKMSGSIPEHNIEIGFPGEIIQKKLRVPTIDMSKLPSAIKHAKLKQLVDARQKAKNSGSTTTIARLIYMRLFGSDEPYEDRSPTGLIEEMERLPEKYEPDDQRFLFEDNATRLQLVVFNHGDTVLRDASITLALPNSDALHVATKLPVHTGQHDEFNPFEFAGYPIVLVKDDRIHASSIIGEIPVNVPVEIFELPLRICAGAELNGTQMAVCYKLFASNLRHPVEGRLAVAFS